MRKPIFVLLTFAMIVTAASLSFGNTKAVQNKVYYEMVDITKGDTLWEIAEKYKTDDISTGDYVSQIKEFNNMKTDVIKVGQIITVPISL